MFHATKSKLRGLTEAVTSASCSSESEGDSCEEDIDRQRPYFHTSADSSDQDLPEEEMPAPDTLIFEINEGSIDGPQPASGKESDHVHWKKVNKRNTASDVPYFNYYSGSDNISAVTPMEYFKGFISDEVLAKICEQSNLYAIQNNTSKPLNLCSKELEQWLGIAMLMSITKISNPRLHWSFNNWSANITSIMSRNRWEEIKSNLYFVDNAAVDKSSKLFEVSLLVDHLRQEFQKIPMAEHLCVAEQTVLFKGASTLKKYNLKISHKLGYNIFILCDNMGMVYDFIPYSGRISPVDNPAVPDLGPSSNSVLHLAECIPPGKHHKIYFNRSFTSAKLIEHLATRKIWACGAVQERRLPGLAFKADRELSKLRRGSFEEFEAHTEATKIIVLKWYDNKSICLASSFLSSHPVKICKRLDIKTREFVYVSTPNIVRRYTEHMEGVELHNKLMSCYRMSSHSRKHYLRLVFHLIDMCVVNSWLLYRRKENELMTKPCHQNSLCEFKMRLANSLLLSKKNTSVKRECPTAYSVQDEYVKKRKTGRATKYLPEEDVRKDGFGHFPAITDARGRCKFPGCKGKIRLSCVKCQVHLCCEKKRNCFLKFHQN